MNGSTHRGSSFKRSALKRLAAFALALALMSGLLPFFPTVPDAGAADWMQPYLDQMVEWGIMQGDANGNLNPDRQITLAEFVTLVNRAFGYTEMDPENPFPTCRTTPGTPRISGLPTRPAISTAPLTTPPLPCP